LFIGYLLSGNFRNAIPPCETEDDDDKEIFKKKGIKAGLPEVC
jgi:hypothetical protein